MQKRQDVAPRVLMLNECHPVQIPWGRWGWMTGPLVVELSDVSLQATSRHESEVMSQGWRRELDCVAKTCGALGGASIPIPRHFCFTCMHKNRGDILLPLLIL